MPAEELNLDLPLRQPTLEACELLEGVALPLS